MNNVRRLGLEARGYTKISKTRRLPVAGDVVVKAGDQVSPDTLIAIALVPGFPLPINIALKLGVEAEDIVRYMHAEVGQELREGDILAQRKLLLGLSEEVVKSPIDGTVESISELTGMVVLRSHPVRVETRAYVGGEVTEVLEGEGAVIETQGVYVQGIFGVGGENYGELNLCVSTPEDILDENDLTNDIKGKIIVGGSIVTLAALKKARRLGAKGVVTGGICDKDLELFVGKKIGLAITGQEELGLSIVVTEGFGRVAMSGEVFSLLESHQGNKASINGTTHLRAETVRPEVIIPLDTRADAHQSTPEQTAGLTTGSPVLIVRHPYFGQRGHVEEIQAEGIADSEIRAVLATVRTEDGNTLLIPLDNLELR